MELINLAPELEPDELKTIGRKVYEAFTEDDQSRQEHMDKHAKWLELYYQTDKAETPLFMGASDDSVPLMANACNQFQARAYKAFFPNRNFVAAEPKTDTSEEEYNRAERVGKHMSYQLTVKQKEYRQDKNSMFLAVALNGSDFSKTYYDPIRRMNVVERVPIQDFVVPYGKGPRRIEDLERMTHVIDMSVNYSKKLAKIGFFTSEIKPNYTGSDSSSALQEAQDDAMGLSETQSYREEFGTVLEQHVYLDLDEDGIDEPYVVWYDMGSQEVKRIQVCWEVDPRTGESTDPDEYKKRVEYFTHYQYLPNPNGFYGLGMGHLIGGQNKSANKLLRMLIDAGVLANAGNMSGFISQNLGIEGDEIELGIGSFKKLPRNVDDIRKGIYQFQFPGPSAALGEIYQGVIQDAEKASSTTDAVTGDIEKVMQPLTIMTLLENSLQLPTSVMEQMAISFEDELAKLYELNRKYFSSEDIFVDDGEKVIIQPQDYQAELRVIPIIDPRNITRQQKVAKAQETYNFIMSNPDTANNPASRNEAARRVLMALEVDDIDRLVPPPPEVQNIDDQDVENMYFMLPKDKRVPFDVFPDQNHVEHILKIHDFLAWLTVDDPIQKVPEEISQQPNIDVVINQVAGQTKESIVAEVIMHLIQHVAFFYGQQRGVLNVGPREQAQMGEVGRDARAVAEALGNLQSLGVLEGMPIPSGPMQTSGPAAGVGPTSGDGNGMGGAGLLGLADIMPRGQG